MVEAAPRGGTESTGRRIAAITVLAVLAGFVLLGVAIHVGATLLVRHRGHLSAADRLTATNAARVGLIQLLGGIGLVGGLVFSVRTYALTRQTQRSDRFAKAVEQLGEPDSETRRAAGAHTLAILASEAPEYWPPTEQLLTSLIRERATAGSPLGSDVRAAFTVLGARPAREPGAKGRPLDLSGIDLTGADLSAWNFDRVRLDDAILAKANLVDVSLQRASLVGCCLDGADLSSADLRDSTCTKATFVGAVLYKADLTGADTTGCDFTGADLDQCKIDGGPA